MDSIQLKVEGTKKLTQRLGRLKGRAVFLAGQGLYREAEKVMAKSKREAPVGVHGTLRSSGFVHPPRPIPGARQGMEVVLGYGGAASGYAVYIHEGTGPAVGQPAFFPPPSALEPWVKKKMGITDPEEVERVAFLVARKIGQKGLEPRKFLERPLHEAMQGMGDRVAAHIRKGLGR